MAAEVSERQRPEQRLTDGVREHVGIRVTRQAEVGVEGDPAQHERPPGDQRMQVDPEADAIHRVSFIDGRGSPPARDGGPRAS